MRSLRVPVALALVAVLTLGWAATVSANGGRPLTTTLSAAEEVPSADPDGSGWAKITVNSGIGEVCWWLEVSNIAAASAAHIHFGDAGVAGPIVVGLSAPTSGQSSGCTEVSRELAKAIRKDPTHYYVNVHNADYPGGAVRGQLGD